MLYYCFLAFSWTMIALSCYMLYRNERVGRERQRVLDICSRLAQVDIEAHRPWKQRYAYYDSVSYDEMLWKFWRPVKSFYDGSDTALNEVNE